MDGVVGEGYLEGARVHEEGQLVDGSPTILAFEGQIGINPSPSILFIRGDANGDGRVDIADAIFVMNALFLGGLRSSCQEASDVNDDSTLDVSDSVFLVNYLFAGASAPSAPFPGCGSADQDGLGCSSYLSCEQ